MRKQKSGIIVNISSALGRFGFPITSAYVSTKFAIEGLSESMVYELEPFGIKMVLVADRWKYAASMMALI